MKILASIGAAVLCAVSATAPVWAESEPQFTRMIVFGDSLSDPGNAFIATGDQSVPPYAELADILIPSAPYAIGGHHFSNGPTWIEQLARELLLVKDAQPALQVTGAHNYAFGGARILGSAENPFDLPEQVRLFLYAGGASLLDEDTLIVIFAGGNDLRQALTSADIGLVFAAVDAMAGVFPPPEEPGLIQRLYNAGGRKFLVANAPNLGLAPAIRNLGMGASGFATFLAMQFNDALVGRFEMLQDQLEGVQVVTFDVFGALNGAVAGGRFADTEAACISPNLPPFHCVTPRDFLFWDGIHPTRAGHEVLKERALVDLEDAQLVR